MRADARNLTFFKHFVSSGRDVAVFLFGMMLLGSAAQSVNAADSEPVKKIDPLLEEDRVHKLSVFSYMQPLQRGGRAAPVLVTLSIVGPEGLRTFCEYRPMIHEAILNVVTDDQVSTGDRQAVLEDMKVQMLEEVNYSLPGEPISSVDARAGRSASEFGQDIVHTNMICKKLDQLER
jgi:hypothetical protein